jgi:hypothetical protein
MNRIFQLILVAFVIWYYSRHAVVDNIDEIPQAAIQKEIKPGGPAPAIPDFLVNTNQFQKERFEKPVLRKGHTGTGLRYIICTQGVFPSSSLTAGNAGPFVGEIRIFSPVQSFIMPTGWVPCDGRLLTISQNTMLFALLGTEYGGDGRTTMAVPDLQGSTVVGIGNGWAITEKSK